MVTPASPGPLDPDATPASGERGWWGAALALGVVAAAPILLHRYLPMADLPLHVLEVAIWAEPSGAETGFAEAYEVAGPWLPYWTTTVLAGLAAPLLGAELGVRMVLTLYALLLPLLGGLAARGFGRSGWWGVPLAGFVYEPNLAWGLIAWCVSGALLLGVLALAARAERAADPMRWLAGLAALSAVLGWTHPQMAVGAWGLVLLLQLARRDLRRGAQIVAAATLALVPTVVWFASPARAHEAFGSAPRFASPAVGIRHLLDCTVDVLPGTVERWSLLLFLGLVAGSWLNAKRPPWEQLRVNVLAGAVLLLYFVAPWEWNGQTVAQRLPYIVLLLVPCCAAPGRTPTWWVRGALVGVGLLAALNTAVHLRQFDREAAASLDPLEAATPAGARLMPAVYDPHSEWVRIPVYLHAAAWITARKGGIYAFHYNRLTSHYRPLVPRAQVLTSPDFFWAKSLEAGGDLVFVDPDAVSFWDTVVARFPEGRPPFPPIAWPPGEVSAAVTEGPWTMFTRRPSDVEGAESQRLKQTQQ